jgi:TonB-linked SusC/RagA family outer membrane protein
MMRKFTLLIALMTFIGMQVALAQTRTLSGTVSNADDGSSIPGVSVVVKGTTIGTTTDMQGRYSLDVPADAQILQFSYIGMKAMEIAIGSETQINISMQPEVTAIEGVVVTALGVTREKKALGYAVQDLGGEEITKAEETNVVNSLSGKVSGVQITNSSGGVGSSSRIVIRGNNSFGNNEPLFIVDGIPILNSSSEVSQWGDADFGNAAMDIDPNSIENISVLKGANAAALYGSRAANGVILITTKKGTTSKMKTGIGVDFSSSITFDNVYIMPNYQNMYGQGFDGSEFVAKQYGVNVSNLAEYQDWAENNSFSYYDGNWGGILDGIDESWGPRLDIGLMLPQFNSPLTDPTDPNTRTKTPWVSNPNNIKDFFETGTTFINTLGISGGSEKGAFRLGLSNTNQSGTIPNTDLKRNNLTFSGTLNVTDRLIAQASANYTQNKSDNLPGGGYDVNNIMQSIGGWFGRQVDMNDLKEKWNTRDVFGNPYNWNRSYHNNPYWTVYNNTTNRQRDRLFGNVNLTYKLTDWLSVMGRVGTDFYSETRKHVEFTESIDYPYGSFWQRESFEQETNADLIFSAEKKLSTDIRMNASLGANYRNTQYRTQFLEAAELTVPNLFTIGNVRGNPTVSMFQSEMETNSVFGSVNLGYKYLLYLDITGRNDWSSTLPKDNWSYFYPSFSLSFVFTELLEIDPGILSFGKLRGGWAQVGNSTNPYQIVPTFSAVTNPFNGIAQFFYTRELPPLDLLPEKTTSVEFGLDLRFLNNRLGLDFTYYDMKTENQIMAVNISNASGFNNMRINAGEIQNTGIEVLLNAKAVENVGGFNWDITLNWATNTNKVNKLYGDLEAYQMASSWGGLTIEARPGEEFGLIKGGAYARDAQGNILVNPASGLRVVAPKPQTIGSITPDWIGGLNNAFRYKGLTFSFLLDARMGGDIFSVTDWFGAYAGITQKTVEGGIRENGIIQEGVFGRLDGSGNVIYLDADGNTSSSPITNDIAVAPQDYFSAYWGLQEPSIIDGSFIKLREIVLSYDLPKKWMTQSGIFNNVNVSLIGRNLAMLYKHKSNDVNIDPETGFGTSLSGLGLEQFQLPSSRSIGFKVLLSF